MTNLLQRMFRGPSRRMLAVDPDAEWSVAGNTYFGFGGPVNGNEQPIPGEYLALAQQVYKANGPVFALMTVRQLVFSEARFKWQRWDSGRPGKLWGDSGLGVLETPWANGTTGALLSRMIQDADLAGNAFIARRGNGTLRRLRPDWVTIVMGSNDDPEMFGDAYDAEVIGYIYHPHGRDVTSADVDVIMPEDMAHFAPTPDPEFQFRGMSWLQPVLREISGDLAASQHKLRFFENGATPQVIVSLDASLDPDKVKRFRAQFEEHYRGVSNAYRTMIFGGGADARVVGANLQQIDFKNTQGAGETRLAAAAGVPASIVGFSEGLAGSSLNAGNYMAARRRFADATMRPMWRMACDALASILPVPEDSRLWYDENNIPFLREDQEVVVKIQAEEASTIQKLITAGYKPKTVTAAVVAGDWNLLEHTGLFSVQLQPPVTAEDVANAAKAATAPPAPAKTPTTPPAQANGKVKIGAKA